MSAHTSEINNLKNKRMILILCLWRDGAIGASKKYTKIPLDCVHACKHNTHHIYRIYARAHIYNILNRNVLAAAVAARRTAHVCTKRKRDLLNWRNKICLSIHICVYVCYLLCVRAVSVCMCVKKNIFLHIYICVYMNDFMCF